jgi:hypothetical protein
LLILVSSSSSSACLELAGFEKGVYSYSGFL